MVKYKELVSSCLKTFNLRSKSGSSLFISTIVVLIIAGIRQSGNLELLELAVYDLMVRSEAMPLGLSRSETEQEQRITIVAIEESDITTWQQSTFSDRAIARLLEKLQQYDPAVIGLDICRDIPQPPGTKRLHSQLAAENVITIEKIGEPSVAAPPNVARDRVGFNNFVVDRDGRIRRNFMSFQSKQGAMYSFALQMSKNYLGADSIGIKPDMLSLRQTNFPSLPADAGGYQLAPSDAWGAQVLLDYRSPGKAARQLSFSQVIDGTFDPEWIAGKIVIVGYTAPSKKDIFTTPFTVKAMSGVEMHAQMTSQILSTVLDRQPLFGFIPQWSEYFFIWVCSIAGGAIVWRFKRPLELGGSLALATIASWSICWLSFISSLWIPVVPVLAGFMATTVVMLAWRNFYNSIIDELTGLANREQIIDLLQQGIGKAKHSELAVLSLNIARFKTINDSLGRSVGDRLLILVGQRMQNSIRSQDKLARVGFAEFAIILFPLKDRDYAIAIARRIQGELARTFSIKGQEITIATELGIAFYQPGEKIQGEELLRNSNLAQERARVLGNDRHAVYVPRMHSETLAQWQLENDLRHGIENREFELHYQPIIELASDRIAGFEALIRWVSPSRGFVSPGEFIPLAEATGLIIPLGEWILREGCRQMCQWQQQFAVPLAISINLSSHQFQADLVEQILAILETTGLPPQHLKLEITESAMMNNVETAIALLHQLKVLGIKLSIDDFGTGYSSLSYLQQFCVDTLKVDQSFVRQLSGSDKDRAIVDIIVTLAHKLEMDVIAEGIETLSHRHILQELNCEYGQGYLFAKPLNSQEATELLARRLAIEVASE